MTTRAMRTPVGSSGSAGTVGSTGFTLPAISRGFRAARTRPWTATTRTRSRNWARKALRRDIALAYVDCDLYSSTVTVLEFLEPRLKHGMIVAFDDYFCWSPTDVSGERAALHEFLTVHPEWNFHRYKDVHWSGVSFVVERVASLPVAHLDAPGREP